MGRGRGDAPALDGLLELADEIDFDDIDRFGFTDAYQEIEQIAAAQENPTKLLALLDRVSSEEASRQIVPDLYEFVADGGLKHLPENFLKLRQNIQEWNRALTQAFILLEAADHIWEADLESPLAKTHYAAARQTYRSVEKAAREQFPEVKSHRLAHNPEARARESERAIVRSEETAKRRAEKAAALEKQRDELFASWLTSIDPEIADALIEARRKALANEPWDHKYEATWADWARKIRHYGQPLDYQIPKIAQMMQWLEESKVRSVARDQIEADREVKLQSAGPIEEGRYEFEGTYIFVKPNDWGPRMIVQLDDGNRLIGSWPRALGTGKLPDFCRLRIKATVKRSDRDEHFGFFSRPHTAEVIG